MIVPCQSRLRQKINQRATSPGPPELAGFQLSLLPRHSWFFSTRLRPAPPHWHQTWTLHTVAAHYFSIRNLRLSKSLPPFGRHLAVRSIAPKAANVDLRLTPYKFQVPSRNLQGVLSVAG